MMESKPPAGTIGWHDLTVSNAETIRNFYRAVVGWRFESVLMGDYEDYSMLTAAGECTAGICHSRGGNADLRYFRGHNTNCYLLFISYVPGLPESGATDRLCV